MMNEPFGLSNAAAIDGAVGKENIQAGDDSSASSIADGGVSCDNDGNMRIMEVMMNGASEQYWRVQKGSLKDTGRIRLWRRAALGCLVAIVLVICILTSRLNAEEIQDYETAFEQFSRTVSSAVVKHQVDVQEAFKTLADSISSTERSVNGSSAWPFVTVPDFELHARNMLNRSGCEIVELFPILRGNQREAWEEYAVEAYEAWVSQAHITRNGNLDRLNETGYHKQISIIREDGAFDPAPYATNGMFLPAWQFSPPPRSYSIINWNFIQVPDYNDIVQASFSLGGRTLWTKVRPYQAAVPTAMTEAEHDALHSDRPQSKSEYPHSITVHPVHEVPGNYSSPVVAVLAGGIAWDFALKSLLPSSMRGIQVVVHNTCGQAYTYRVDGQDAFFVGAGDLHETKYDRMRVMTNLSIWDDHAFDTTPGHCIYSMSTYPTKVFEGDFNSNVPKIFVILVTVTLGIIVFVFLAYDLFVEKRNNNLVKNAARSHQLVSSLFPDNIRDQLLDSGPSVDRSTELAKKSQPLAELFVESTVSFADIVGFTAWSSVREPTQVFTLLETVYSSFDTVARQLGVYKLETVGDCYVSVIGVPKPRKDHATVMIRFARQILREMKRVTNELEVILGPGTGDLDLRIGVHSGPVTAGVLRGERARFQLFGDTMNTCSRIESKGEGGRIHISRETAKLLIDSGKQHWIKKGANCIAAKGKGELETYWISSSATVETESTSSHRAETENVRKLMDKGGKERHLRLVDWNVESLAGLLSQVVSMRPRPAVGVEASSNSTQAVSGKIPIQEVEEVIVFREIDNITGGVSSRNELSSDLSNDVLRQLRELVSRIATMYHEDNAFHSFDHASHVVMSVLKLMSRIVEPNAAEGLAGRETNTPSFSSRETGREDTSKLQDRIASDPIARFAVAFSALIHDIDHRGVSNSTLITEQPSLALVYNQRSVAEQNSFDLAWGLLMEEQYAALRQLLCPTQSELQRFRQLVINSVMATDIMDKDLKVIRNFRWEKAFKDAGASDNNEQDSINRKVTIVLEHLIQASDVAHTMQHWHVFRKWNECLFREMYNAYRAGRASNNPADTWYEGELGFFDFYVIPLAKKLKDCGVFGVASAEYLNYALENRTEWEEKGQQVVAMMVQNMAG